MRAWAIWAQVPRAEEPSAGRGGHFSGRFLRAWQAGSLRRSLAAALVVFALTRTLVFGAVGLAPLVVPEASDGGIPQIFARTETPRIADALVRWDGVHYLRIAEIGYTASSDRRLETTRYWPLYPLLMGALGGWAGEAGLVYAGLVVSNLALLVSLVLLYHRSEEELGAATARRTVLYMALFPGTVFFSALYAEALLVLLCVLSLEMMAQRRWLLAGVVGFLAALTRGPGVLLVVPLLVEAFRAYGFSFRGLARPALASGLIVGGLLLFMGVLWAQMGHPLAFTRTLQLWDRVWMPVAEDPAAAAESALAYFGTQEGGVVYGGPWIGVFGSLLFVAGIAWLFRRGLYCYGVYSVVTLAFYLSLTLPVGTGTLIRYLAPIFPAFLAFGAWGEHRVFRAIYVIVATVLLVVASMLFAQGYWVG